MDLSELRGCRAERLDGARLRAAERLAAKARVDALEMIAAAGSGHPGGALSSLDLYVMLWVCARVTPATARAPDRDRIVVSHGHTAAGLYAALGNTGFFEIEECKRSFRTAGSRFEGHPCVRVPGVEWCSGSLGQGLSVGCGFALAARLLGRDYSVFVVMGDGEQAKGQVHEAREFAAKYRLGNLIALVDCNDLQASGAVADIMPQNIAGKYAAAGWRAIEVDGHDPAAIYGVLRTCRGERTEPTAILARTVMGKGVAAIENRHEYHGQPLTPAEHEKAVAELRPRAGAIAVSTVCGAAGEAAPVPDEKPVERRILAGAPATYKVGQMVDCRSAFGAALRDLAAVNAGRPGIAVAALDCDLVESVRLQSFRKEFPGQLIECGIQEHNAATVAAALSKAGVLTFFADFGVFSVDETYGQHRMSDLSGTSLKLVATHCGLDVGEDGKTHQCVDYVGLMANLWGFRVLVPADANQADRMIRYAATTPGNIAIAMGRSKCPVLADEQGRPVFGDAYRFEYGRAEWIRTGGDATIVTLGAMAWRAVSASEKLRGRGLRVGVLNLSSPAEPDTASLDQAARAGLVVTYEDHNVRTGIGGIVGAFLSETGNRCIFRRMGIRQYGFSATPDWQYERQGLSDDDLVKLILEEKSR